MTRLFRSNSCTCSALTTTASFLCAKPHRGFHVLQTSNPHQTSFQATQPPQSRCCVGFPHTRLRYFPILLLNISSIFKSGIIEFLQCDYRSFFLHAMPEKQHSKCPTTCLTTKLETNRPTATPQDMG